VTPRGQLLAEVRAGAGTSGIETGTGCHGKAR
jgi:hypothetical protein